MRELLPFLVPACGLLWMVEGAGRLLSSLGRNPGPRTGQASRGRSSPAFVRGALSFIGHGGLTGAFWLGLGCATLWFADYQRPWILPAVGLFWLIIGVRMCLTAFRKRNLDTPANGSASESIPPLRQRRMSGAFWLLVGSLTLWFSDISIGGPPEANAKSTPEKSSLAAIVTQLVDEDFQQRAHVGIVIGAVAMDQEFLSGFGTRVFGSPEPPDADTVFEIGSITKTFTGLLLAKRIDEGTLKLDDRVTDLLPEGWRLSEPATNITLRHLTTHTSGFPRLPSNLLGTARLGRSLFGGDPYRNYSEEQFREALEQVELEFEPGQKHRYSNFAVGLLGFVLATHNGSDYETLLKNDLCKPLGMDRTTITNEPWHDEHLAPGYRSSMKLGTAVTVLGSSAWELPNHLAGAGAIRSTGTDMMKYLKANMGLIDTPIDDAIRLSHTTLYEERKDRAIGMNWIRSLDENIEQEVIWHNGGTGGYRSYLGFTEDCRLGVVVLCNTQNDADALGQRILREMVRQLGTGESPR